MQRLVVVLAVVGCSGSKDAPPGPTTGSAPIAIVVDAGPPKPPAFVELLRGVPATIRVSSKVANPKIRPEHMIDRDFNTAWNSVTGELVGAWIEVVIPQRAAIAELKMTVGHTGKGPKGEDYFAMNYRIKQVSLLRDSKVLAAFVLDPDNRELQTMKLPVPGGTLRIRIDDVVPGTQKTWRETAVSELEVWGTPPPSWVPPGKPLGPIVEVNPPPPAQSIATLCPIVKQPSAAELERRRNAACASESSDEARAACRGEWDPGGTTCTATPLEIANAGPPWRGAAMHCERSSGMGATESCEVVLEVDRRLVRGPELQTWGMGMASADDPPFPIDHPATVEQIERRDVIAGEQPEIILRYRGPARGVLVVCRATPVAECSEPIEVAGDDWSARTRIVDGEVVVEPDSDPDAGKPPVVALGKKPIVFP